MRILVLGAGRMGLGCAFDLIHSPDVDRVTLADLDLQRAEGISQRLQSSKLTPVQIDVEETQRVVELMRGHDAVISCVVYKHNFQLATAAIAARTHFCDLGGNNDVVNQELALNSQAEAAGTCIIPDCGLAPGLVSVLAAHGAAEHDALDSIQIRVGGLPLYPKPPMNYQIVFSIEGLINEYVEPARVVRNGRIESVESMTEIEPVQFPAPFGDLEAFHTSGGVSTLPESFLGRVRSLDYKTIRYPGHCRQFQLLIDLGLTSEKPVHVRGVAIAPRRLLAELLQRRLPADEPDAVLVRLEFKGRCGNVTRHTTYDIIDRFDDSTGLSAMMRMTAFPTSIVAQMMARREITARGSTTLERSVPTQLFLKALADRRIQVQKRVTENP